MESHHFCANKKVTGSQDDGFVEGVEKQLVRFSLLT
jgi:hypothetical protein